MAGRWAAHREHGSALVGCLIAGWALAGCGDVPAGLVDTTVAPQAAYPFFAQVRSETLGYLCGGALIAPSWVLTAAHCVVEGLTVVIGRSDLDDATQGEVRAVAEVHPHPSWSPTAAGHDVALLLLATPSTLPPIRLADAPAEAGGVAVRALGHALTEGGGYAGRLRQLDLLTRPDAVLTDAYGAGFAPDTMLGAGLAPGQNPFCAGDRGAPLVTTDTGGHELVGVTGRERGCPPLARPALFADVVSGPVRNWIEAQVPRQLAAMVLADQPSATAAYRPAIGSGPTTVTRTDVGAYTVSFGGVGHGVTDGVTHVTAYGSEGVVCWVVADEPVGPAQQALVRCVDGAGAPADSAFSASFARPVDTGPYAAVTVAGADLASTYNSAGAANTVRRNGTGDHTVSLPSVASERAAVAVTPHGERPATCTVADVEPLRVRCFTPGGLPVDTAFGLTVTDEPAPAPPASGGWAWVASGPAGAATASTFNSAGGANTVGRTGPGTYAARLGGMTEPGIVHVATVGQRPQRCAPTDQLVEGGGVTVMVHCDADAAFVLLFQY